MNNKLEFTDGTIIDGTAGSYGQWLYLYVDRQTMLDHMTDFMDPAKMDSVTFYYSVYKDIFSGFNQFCYVELPPASEEFVIKLHGDPGCSVEHKIPTVPVEYLPTA